MSDRSMVDDSQGKSLVSDLQQKIDAWRQRLQSGDPIKLGADFFDLAQSCEARAREIEQAHGYRAALSCLSGMMDVLSENLQFCVYYIQLLVRSNTYEAETSFLDTFEAKHRGNVWAWYWLVWGAMERNRLDDASSLLDRAEAIHGAAPELALSKALFFQKQGRSRDLVQHITQNPQLIALHGTIIFDIYFKALYELGKVDEAAAAWSTYPLGPIAIQNRIDVPWRFILSDALRKSEPDQAPTPGIDIFIGSLEDLIVERPDEASTLILRKLAEAFYKDKTTFRSLLLELSSYFKNNSSKANVLRNLISFISEPNAAVGEALIADAVAFAERGNLNTSYFVFNHIWSGADALHGQLLKLSARDDAAKLISFIFSEIYYPVLARGILASVEPLDHNIVPKTPQQLLGRFAAARSRLLARNRSGKALSSPRRLKIAVCVSGQFRGYQSAFPSWSCLGLQDHDVTVYVESWYGIGRKAPTPQNVYRCFPRNAGALIEKYFLSNDYGDFFRRYPNLSRLLSDAGTVSEAQIRDFYDTPHVHLEDDGEARFAGMPNAQKMYLKNEKCFHRAVNGDRSYDLMVRIRPDIYFKENSAVDLRALYLESAKRGVFFADRAAVMHLEMGLIYPDQLAIGTQEVMMAYSATHSFTQREGGRAFAASPHFTPHTTLSWNCLNMGIRSEVMPGIQGTSLLGPDVYLSALLIEHLERDLLMREQDAFDLSFMGALRRDATQEIGA